ncbi:MAG: hypothetical protein ACR2QJ_16495 [Geminicoccaceae bacterium]
MTLILTSILFVAIFSAIGVGLFCLFKTLIFHQLSTDTRELAGSGLFRVASIHAFIVGLVFSHLVADFSSVQDQVNQEASTLLSISKLLNEFGGAQAKALISETQEYLENLHYQIENEINDDDRKFEKTAMKFHLRAGDLEPMGQLQELIKVQILQQSEILIKNQIQRVGKTYDQGAIIFIAYYFLGFIIILLFMSINSINKQNLAIIGVFSGFIGLTTIFIFALSDPYKRPGKVSPKAYLNAASHIETRLSN